MKPQTLLACGVLKFRTSQRHTPSPSHFPPPYAALLQGSGCFTRCVMLYHAVPPHAGGLGPVPFDLPTTCHITVPAADLGPGDSLLLVGSLPELGDW
jgi:hypothetical protein